jgi:HSP20 family molecular chaperone IbpA
MIDDDFESAIRRMFESIMGSLNTFPEGSESFSFFSGSTVNGSKNEIDLSEEREPEIEQIDLEDQMLILVEIGFTDGEYSVRVDDRNLIITYGLENKEKRVTLDFDVDFEKSKVTSRNGVMEISLVKSKKDDSGLRSGYLKIE